VAFLEVFPAKGSDFLCKIKIDLLQAIVNKKNFWRKKARESACPRGIASIRDEFYQQQQEQASKLDDDFFARLQSCVAKRPKRAAEFGFFLTFVNRDPFTEKVYEAIRNNDNKSDMEVIKIFANLLEEIEADERPAIQPRR